MIKQETAAAIYSAYREIKAATELLGNLETEMRKCGEQPDHATLRDAFGRERGLQLGVPSGESSHQLYNVAPQLAASVIRAHIAEKQTELVKANETARMELDLPD